jgi:hypothetical protein
VLDRAVTLDEIRGLASRNGLTGQLDRALRSAGR